MFAEMANEHQRLMFDVFTSTDQQLRQSCDNIQIPNLPNILLTFLHDQTQGLQQQYQNLTISFFLLFDNRVDERFDFQNQIHANKIDNFLRMFALSGDFQEEMQG